MRAFSFIVSLAAITTALAASSSSGTSSASAANPTSTAGITPCVLSCSNQAALSSGCVSYTNFTCVCVNPAFGTAASACFAANCSAADTAAADTLSQGLCASFTNSSSSSSSASSPATTKSAGNSILQLGSTPLISGLLVILGGFLVAPALL